MEDNTEKTRTRTNVKDEPKPEHTEMSGRSSRLSSDSEEECGLVCSPPRFGPGAGGPMMGGYCAPGQYPPPPRNMLVNTSHTSGGYVLQTRHRRLSESSDVSVV